MRWNSPRTSGQTCTRCPGRYIHRLAPEVATLRELENNDISSTQPLGLATSVQIMRTVDRVARQYTDPSITKDRLGFLDHLRIFAFLSVLLGHALYRPLSQLAEDGTQHATVRALVSILLPLLHLGGAGVAVFFLVSGYIITRVLQVELPGEFAIKRFFRIYPLYIAAVLAQWVSHLITGMQAEPQVLAMQLTLLGDLNSTPYSLGGVEWTLRIEIMFYVFMGGLSWATRKLRITMTMAAPWIFPAIVVLLALLPPLTSGTLRWGHWPATGVINLYFPLLLVGSMVFIHEKGGISGTWLACFIALVYAEFYWLTPRYQPLWKEDHHAIIALVIFLVAWAVRSKLYAGRAVRWLSDLTYPVYLFHNWLYFAVVDQLAKRSELPMVYCTAISFAVLFLVCSLGSRLLEKPFIVLGRRIVAGRRSVHLAGS